MCSDRIPPKFNCDGQRQSVFEDFKFIEIGYWAKYMVVCYPKGMPMYFIYSN